MEEHPIPQNVTDFEFHLVGDMTLKQFGYLAAGCVTAYIIFVTFGKETPFIAYPLVAFFAGTGIAFAFLPIQQRPLDHWLVSFIKAILSPTQRKYKSELLKNDDPFFKRRLSIYFASQNGVNFFIPLKPLPTPAATPAQLQPVQQQTTSQPTQLSNSPAISQTSTPKPTTPPSSDEINKTVELAKEAQIVQTKIVQTEKELEEIKLKAATPGNDPKQFTAQFQQSLTDLQKFNYEAKKISQQLAQISKTLPSKLHLETPVKTRSIPSLTLTQTANIINGIVTDSLGNYVEGAVVVAHDKQSLPVRALKTNKLGQFIAATPLPAGSYTLTVEKDDLLFNVIEVELKDKVLNPVVISAKKASISV